MNISCIVRKLIIAGTIIVTLSPSFVGIHAQDIMRGTNERGYAVIFEQRVFQVTLVSDYGLPERIDFSLEQKSISIELTNLLLKDTAYFEVTIPKELLSGEFTATLAGNHITLIRSDKEAETSLQSIILKSFVEQNAIGESALMVITGTEVIPEFPTSMLVFLLAFVLSTFMLTRKNAIKILGKDHR